MGESMEDSVRWLQRVVDLDLLRRAEVPWCPRADVYRTPRGWAIKLEIAGVSPQDITCGISGNTLVIRGCRRDTVVQHGWQVHHMEIEYAEFTRTFEFPSNLRNARLTLQAEQGMLVIHIETEEEGAR